MILERLCRKIAMEKALALTALSALANAARLDLLRLLIGKGDQGMAAGEIGRSIGLSASLLSFHLAALESAGLIGSRKQARNVIYAVDTAQLGALMSYLLNDCCMDHPEVLACCNRKEHESVSSCPGSERSALDRSDPGL